MNYHYHNRVMNLSTEQYKVCWSESDFRIYKIGHRDARHAAAEIANEADAKIEKLKNVLQEISDGVFCDLKSVEEYATNALKE